MRRRIGKKLVHFFRNYIHKVIAHAKELLYNRAVYLNFTRLPLPHSSIKITHISKVSPHPSNRVFQSHF